MISIAKRFIKIIAICFYYGLDRAVLPKILCPSLLLGIFKSIRSQHQKSLGERMKLACIDLGPLFVKFGQLISIRHDLFSIHITQPLSELQNKVPGFDPKLAIQTIEKELGQSIDQLFLSFDPKPLASASIAQVHQALLKDNREVVIKVLRPGIKKQLKIDIKILKTMALLLSLCKRWKRHTLQALIEEYSHTLFQEINLSYEGAHYSQMHHYFQNDPRLHVPKVYWKYTKKSVLTLEKINAIPIAQIGKYPNIDRKTLAYNGVDIFFTQVFKHRFFHADMHPGNVFIEPGHPPKYIAIDFGIVGTLSQEDQYYLAENFLAFYHRDYHRIAALHIESGWVGKNTQAHKLEEAIRHVCEPIFARNIEEISIAELMYQLIEASKPFDLYIQPQLLILQKTLFHVEAMGRSLYPQLNLWDAAKPFIEDFMKQRASLKTASSLLKKELPRIIEIMPTLPHLLEKKLSLKSEKPSPSLPTLLITLSALNAISIILLIYTIFM